MVLDYSGAKAAGYSDDEIAPYLKDAADKAVAAGYDPKDVRAQFTKVGVPEDRAFDATASTPEKIGRSASDAAGAVGRKLSTLFPPNVVPGSTGAATVPRPTPGMTTAPLTPGAIGYEPAYSEPTGLQKAQEDPASSIQSEIIPGLKQLKDLQARGPQNAADVAQAVAAAGHPDLATAAGVLAGAPTVASQVATPIPGTVGEAAAMGLMGVGMGLAAGAPAGTFNPEIPSPPPAEYAYNVLRRRLGGDLSGETGLGARFGIGGPGPTGMMAVDQDAATAQMLADGNAGAAAKLDPALRAQMIAARQRTFSGARLDTPAPVAPAPLAPPSNLDIAPVAGTLAGDLPGVAVPRVAPQGATVAGVDAFGKPIAQADGENLLAGMRPDNNPEMFSGGAANAFGTAPAPLASVPGPATGAPGGSSSSASPTGAGAGQPGSSQIQLGTQTGGLPPPIGEQASPESIPARSLPVKGVGTLPEIMEQGARDFGTTVADPHLPARIVAAARDMGAQGADMLRAIVKTSASPKTIALFRDSLARDIARLRAFGVEAPEDFHAAIAEADSALLKPPGERGKGSVAGDILSNREIEKMTGMKAWQLTPEQYAKVAPDNDLAAHRDAVFNAMWRQRDVPPHVAAAYPDLAVELAAHEHEQSTEALSMEKPTAIKIARRMGIDPVRYRRYNSGELKSLEDSPAGRFIFRAGGHPLDDLAEAAWEDGLIPENDVNLYKDLLNEELASGGGTLGGQSGMARLFDDGKPEDTPAVAEYKSRIHDDLPPGFSFTKLVNDLRVEQINKDAALEDLSKIVGPEAEKQLAVLLSRRRGLDALAFTAFHIGTYDFGLNALTSTKTGEGLGAILKDVSVDGVKDFDAYLIAKRTLELAGRDKPIEGLHSELAPQVIIDLEAKYGRAIQINAQRYWNWWRRFTKPFEEILGAGRYQALLDKGEYYTILHREMDEVFGDGTPGSGNPLKSIKGSSRDVMSSLQSTIKQAVSVSRYFERARLGWLLSDLNTQLKANPEWSSLIKEVAAPGKNTVSVTRAGATTHLQLAPELKRAYEDLPPSLGRATMNILGTMASLPRAGITLNPVFALFSHPVRYQMEAFLFNKGGFVPGVDWLRGLTQRVLKGPAYQQLMAEGGLFTSEVAQDVKNLPNTIAELAGQRKASAMTPLKVLQWLREIDDQAVRIGAFMRNQSAGAPSSLAAAQTRESVVDPSRRGASGVSAFLGKTVPFYNIHVQSLAKLLNVASGNAPLNASPARFYTALSALIAFTAALWHHNKDDKEYQERPFYQKVGNWFIPDGKNPDGTTRFHKVPKPFFPGTVFLSGAEMLLQQLYEKDPHAVKLWATQSLGDLLPLPIPPFVMIPGELAANHDLFRGRPIEPASTSHLLPEDRGGDYTSDLAKMGAKTAVGRALGASPAKIDYTLTGVGGSLARKILEASNPYLDKPGAPTRIDQPFSPFERPATGSDSESVNRFYQYMTHMEQAHASLNHGLPEPDQDAGPVLERFRDVKEFIDEMKGHEKAVMGSKIDADHKAALIAKYNTQITNQAAAAVKMYEGRESSGRQVR
jgi:hypothetical protein